MPKPLAPPPKPDEIRAARVRATFLILFATLLIGLLLAVAWTGAAMSRRNDPTALRLELPLQGTMTFDVAALARASARELAESDAAERTLLAGIEPLLQEGLHQRAQLFFLAEGPDTTTRWVAWLPVRRPQRYAHEQLAAVLKQSTLFLPIGAPVADQPAPVGFFLAKARGLIFTSENLPPAHSVDPQPVSGEGSAEYLTPTDYLPPMWAAALSSRDLDLIEAQVLVRILWQAPDPTAGTTGSVRFEFDGAPAMEVGWFNPLVGTDVLR